MEDILNRMNAVTDRLEQACADGSARRHADYAASDKGQIPEDLPCGILSEDGVYNLFYRQKNIALQIARTALKALE